MPDWKKPYDLYNTTFDTKQFNPYYLKVITKEVYDKYVVYKACLTCECWFDCCEPKPKCYQTSICMLRPKDFTVSGQRHIVTKGTGKGSGPTLMILIGNLVWCYENGLRFIFRPCVENGIEMHHININSHDNRFVNTAMIEMHSKLHGKLKKLKTTINNLNEIAMNSVYSKDLYKEIIKIQTIYEREMKDVKDSQKTWDIIDVVNAVLDGVLTADQGQIELEKLNAAFPKEVIENKEKYDYRKLKGEHNHIKELIERQKGAAGAI